MIQRSTAALSVGLFLLAMGGSVHSAQEKQTLETRVQQLEFQISADSATIQTLLLDIETLQTKQAKVESYLTAQADEADSMAAVLDNSEREGFAQGINYHSRELLLAGWRSQLKQLRTDVPGAAEAPKAPDRGRGIRR